MTPKEVIPDDGPNGVISRDRVSERVSRMGSLRGDAHDVAAIASIYS